MNKYTLISNFYDLSAKNNYCNYRKETIESLNIKQGNTVVDIACGTGLNFKYIKDKIGPHGTLIGVDYSSAMLRKAKKKIVRNKWENSHLLQKDVSGIQHDDLTNLTGKSNLKIDAILCTLGFTVIPEWENAFNSSFHLLKNDGYFAIMDAHFKYDSLSTKINEFLSGGDGSRRTWELLEKKSRDYSKKIFPIERFPSAFIKMGYVPESEMYAFVASGKK